jgi:hypothetical protein
MSQVSSEPDIASKVAPRAARVRFGSKDLAQLPYKVFPQHRPDKCADFGGVARPLAVEEPSDRQKGFSMRGHVLMTYGCE